MRIVSSIEDRYKKLCIDSENEFHSFDRFCSDIKTFLKSSDNIPLGICTLCKEKHSLCLDITDKECSRNKRDILKKYNIL